MKSKWRAIALLWLGLVWGCAPAAVTPEDPNRIGDQEVVPKGSGSPETLGVVAEDYWEAVYLQKSQIGFAHTQRERIKEDGQELWRTTTTTYIELLRFGQRSTQQSTIESVENDDGRLVRFTTSSDHGAALVRSQGSVANGQLTIKTTIGEQESVASIPWDDSGGGFDAVNKSLLRAPLQAGENRSITTLVPGIDQPTPARVQLIAGDWQPTDLVGTSARLLRIDAEHELAGGAMMSVVAWMNERGEIVKTEPAPGMFTVRTSAESAQRIQQGDTQPDIGRDQLVRLATPAGDLHRAQRVTYRVRLNDDDPVATFPTQRSQQVAATDDPHIATLTVIALRPDPTAEKDPAPPAACLDANPLVQSDDPRIRALATQAVGEAQGDVEQAAAIEKFVQEYIQEVNFSQAFGTAVDVAESHRGDCTEHAVLLAALARASGIPARVAVGLVYTQSARNAGFAFHMWDELYVAGQWIPYDATLGLGGIGGGHIKLSDSHLADGSALSSFLPVMQVMGSLSIEVVTTDSP